MIYDISQPIFECEVYPGDPKPELQPLSRIESGDLYNLTAFPMCAYNGTHVDHQGSAECSNSSGVWHCVG